jgi:hypothetical protein
MSQQPSDRERGSRLSIAPRRVIATGLARTGATYILLSLREAEGVKIYGEVLRKARRGGRPNQNSFSEFRRLAGRGPINLRPRRSRIEYVDMMLTPTEEAPIVGVKLLPLDWCWPKRYISWSPELVKAAIMPKFRAFVNSEHITVLLFVRENILKMAVSTQLAARDESWSSVHRRSAETIHLDPRTLVKTLTKLEASQRVLIDLCSELDDCTTIIYEAPREEKLATAFAALGLPATAGAPAIGKQTPDDLRAVISNYDEVARTLEGTPFEQHL